MIQQIPFWEKTAADFKRELRACNPKLDKNTLKYIDYFFEREPLPQKPKQGIPFFCKKEQGRNLSAADRVAHYVFVNNVPTSLSSGTGKGKSSLFEYLSLLTGVFVEPQMATSSTSIQEFLPQIGQDPERGIIEYVPAPLVRSSVYGGPFFLDEGGNMKSESFRTANNIIQGRREPAKTQFGMIYLPWQRSTFVLAGNYHDQETNFDAAVLYRFVWVEMPSPDLELKRIISAKQLGHKQAEEAKRMGIPYNISQKLQDHGSEYSVELKTKNFVRNSDLCNVLVELAASLTDSAETLQRGQLQGNGSGKSWIPSFKKNGSKVPWSSAPEISLAVMEKMTTLYHPIMNSWDYYDVLNDILVNPAIATENNTYPGTETGFQPAVDCYVRDLRTLVDQHVDHYISRIESAARKG